MPRDALIQLRAGTSAQWALANPVLALGEQGYDSDLRLTKIGDGSTAWASLTASGGVTGTGGGAVTTTAGVASDAALAGTFGRKVVIDSRDYSMPTDGTSDCLSALNAMVTAAAAVSGGAEIFLSAVASTYYTSALPSLPVGVSLSSRRATKLTTGGTAPLVLSGENEVHHITLASTQAHGTVMMSVGQNAVNIDVHHVTFNGGPNQATAFQHAKTGTSRIRITDCLFQEVDYGILFDQQGCDVTGVQILNNRFLRVFADAIELNWPSNAWIAGSGGSDFQIIGNRCTAEPGFGSTSSSGFGIGIAGARDGVVANNTITGARYQGIHLEDFCKNVAISGNAIKSTGGGSPSSGTHGISIANSSGLSITDNSISNAGAIGISLEYTTGQIVTSTVVTGNNVVSSGDVGIAVGGDSAAHNVTVTGNVITGSVGHGISLSGTGWNIRCEGNVSASNGGYGLRVGTAGKSGATIGRNTYSDNTLGDISYAYTSGRPLPVVDYEKTFIVTEAGSGVGIPLQDFMLLGVAADGLLFISSAQGSSFASHVYRLKWDGTNLINTRIRSDTTGVMAIRTPAMNGKYLQIGVSDSGGPSAVKITAAFRGVVYHDGDAGTPGALAALTEPAITVGTAAPTTGTWRIGDFRINTSGGSVIGWRCAVAGTPGTWIAHSSSSGVTEISAADRSYLGWNVQPTLPGLTTTQLTSGNVYFSRVKIQTDGAIGHVTFGATAAASGLTVNKVAVYDQSGVQLGVSADLGATMTATTQTVALASPTAAQAAGSYVLVAIIQVGTTPIFIRALGSVPLCNIGLVATNGYAWGYWASQTDMPSSLTLASTLPQTSTTPWFAVAI